MRNIVIDSGVFIALFNRSDRYHPQALDFIKRFSGIGHTNLPVITEVVHMLDFSQQAQRDFLSWVHQSMHIDAETPEDWSRILAVLDQYSDLPADFADASLIALCERLDTALVASVDSDFTIYRNTAKRPFQNIFFNEN